MSTFYVARAALVVVLAPDSTYRYVYRGERVSASQVDRADADRIAAKGLLMRVEVPEQPGDDQPSEPVESNA